MKLRNFILVRKVANLIQNVFIDTMNILSRDVQFMGFVKANIESQAFINTNLEQVPYYKDRYSLLTKVLHELKPKSNYIFCEFGVFTGESLRFLASLKPNSLWFGFDSFKGLESQFARVHPKDDFYLGIKEKTKVYESIKAFPNVTLIEGYFETTLPAFVVTTQTNNQKVFFIHFDCDLFSSTSTVLHLIEPILAFPCIFVFDEFFNHPNWEQNEFKAFNEWICQTAYSFHYLAYSNHQVCIVIDRS